MRCFCRCIIMNMVAKIYKSLIFSKSFHLASLISWAFIIRYWSRLNPEFYENRRWSIWENYYIWRKIINLMWQPWNSIFLQKIKSFHILCLETIQMRYETPTYVKKMSRWWHIKDSFFWHFQLSISLTFFSKWLYE